METKKNSEDLRGAVWPRDWFVIPEGHAIKGRGKRGLWPEGSKAVQVLEIRENDDDRELEALVLPDYENAVYWLKIAELATWERG